MLENRVIHISEKIKTNGIIIDDGTLPSAEIHISENIQVWYLFLPKRNGVFSRKIHIETGGKFSGSGILSMDEGDITIETIPEGDDVTCTLQILALAQDNAKLSVKGISRVEQPYKNIFTRVDQTNILLGRDTIIKGMPILQIATDNIEGGHSCKVHRLGGEGIFYLNSRGLDTKNAEALLLSGEIRRHLEVLDMESREEAYEEILLTLH